MRRGVFAAVVALSLGTSVVSACSSNESPSSSPPQDAGDAADDTQADGAPQCIGKQAAPTTGSNCVCPDDCDIEETCFDELSTGRPGGECLRSCTEAPCPDGFECVPLESGQSKCYLPCVAQQDCLQGSLCTYLSDVPGQHHCLDYCTSDADCPVTGKCNRFSGRCVAPTFVPTGADPGQSCTLHEDCKSLLCDTSVPNGLCTTLCLNGTCPADTNTRCVKQTGADYGLCLFQCATDAECPAGQKCYPTPAVPPGFCYK